MNTRKNPGILLSCLVVLASVMISRANAQAPDLVPSAAVFTNIAVPGQSVGVDYTVQNIGDGEASSMDSAWTDSVYFSTDAILDGADILLFQHEHGIPVASGNSYTESPSVYLPLAIPVGEGFLIVVSDIDGEVGDSNYGNNTAAFAVTVSAPDLVPTAAHFSGPAIPGQSVNLEFMIANQGGADAPPDGYYDRVYLSQDNVVDGGDFLLNEPYHLGVVETGASYSQNNNVYVPLVPPGNYYLIVVADQYNSVLEDEEGNNEAAFPVTIVAVDFTPTTASFSGPALPGHSVGLNYTVLNQGTADAVGLSYYDRVYLSQDTELDGGDTMLVEPYLFLTVTMGSTYEFSGSVNVPSVPAGDYYLIVVSDHYNFVQEVDDANNQSVFPVTITAPDLVPQSAFFISPAMPGESVTLEYTISNAGTADAPPDGYYDRVYLSQDDVLDGGDTLLTENFQSAMVPSNGSYNVPVGVTIPYIPTGNYHLIVVADQYGQMPETNEGNNEAAYPVQIVALDLIPVEARLMPSSTVGYVDIEWDVANQGSLGVPINRTWWDHVYFSTDTVLDGGDTNLSNQFMSNPLAAIPPGGGYTGVQPGVSLPMVVAGTYYLIVTTDAYDYLVEENNANNEQAFAVDVLADLSPVGAMFTASALPGQNVDVEYIVENRGLAELSASSYYDRVYLSVDGIVDGSDILLGERIRSASLAVGTSYTESLSCSLPVIAAGNYHLIVVTDNYEYQTEIDEGNNSVAYPVTIVAPDLVPTAASFDAPALPGGSVNLGITVRNDGTSAVPGVAHYNRVYLSADATLDGADIMLAEFYQNILLATGDSYNQSLAVTVPGVASGAYHLIVVADFYDYLPELSEVNNTAAYPVTIVAPDLVPTAASFDVPALPGGSVNLGITVRNDGTSAVPGIAHYNRVYLSVDATLDGADMMLAEFYQNILLASGDSYNQSLAVTVPGVAAGAYHLIVVADFYDYLPELSEVNNTAAFPVTIVAPDLVPTAASFDAPAVPGGSVNLSITVWNDGTSAVPSIAHYDRVYLSVDATLDGADTMLTDFYQNVPLAMGDSYNQSLAVTVPGVTPGSYHLIVVADYYGYLPELSEVNNTAAFPVMIVAPDFVPLAATLAPRGSGGDVVTVEWEVGNQGTAALEAGRYWYDNVYLSTDATLDGGDQLLVQSYQENPITLIGVGTRYLASAPGVTLPSVPVGQYFLIVVTDAYDYLSEVSDANNTVAFPVGIGPDLVNEMMVDLDGGAMAGMAGGTIGLGFTAANVGGSTAPAATRTDSVYLSTDAEYGVGDQLMGAVTPSAELGVQQDTNFTLPEVPTGWYYLIVRHDSGNDIEESNEGNNTASLPVFVADNLYSMWAFTNGLSGADALPGANPAGDGIPNLQKYAFNMIPGVAYHSARMVTGGTAGLPLLVRDPISGRLRAEYVRRTDDPELTYEVMFGDTPSTLSPAVGTETVTPIGPGWVRVVIQDEAAAPDAASRFGNVRVMTF